MKKVGKIGHVAAIVLPYLLYELLRFSRIDTVIQAPLIHFYIVSAVTAIATVLGIMVGIIGRQLRNSHVNFLSLAFISLASICTVHGLGFVLYPESHELPTITAQLSIFLATIWLWMSSLSADHYLVRWLSRWNQLLVPVWSVLLIFGCGLFLFYPEISCCVPLDGGPVRIIAVAIIILLNGYTIYSYHQSYRYSKLPLQIAIVYGAGWFIIAQIIMVRDEVSQVSWWLFHFLLLGAMIVMLSGLIRQYGLNRSLSKTIQALYTEDPVERIMNVLPKRVRELIMTVEEKDSYTAGHNFRVTLYALKIAEEMGLDPEERRAIVMGTIVHDVGKIDIPDKILNKNGPLTPKERRIVEQHPLKGYELCKKLGFMQEELWIIRSHHERMDGQGYPDRLRGEEIPLLARIVAVVDVYDALTSARAYREAWSHEETIEYITRNKNRHFDPEVVEAWKRVCVHDSLIKQSAHQAARLFSMSR